jgi:XTP/dITP diphosphohydrolase
MHWVLATGNRGKQRELQALLAPWGIQTVLQAELGVEPAEENGDSFEANALIKARHAAQATGLPALADDSGLEVDVLGGAPGVRSARYAGEQATDETNLALLLHNLAPYAAAACTARYHCVIAFVRSADDDAPLLAHGVWEGRIIQKPRGTGGFGYDPVFVPAGSALTVAEWDAAAKNAVSHRGQALLALRERLPGALR